MGKALVTRAWLVEEATKAGYTQAAAEMSWDTMPSHMMKFISSQTIEEFELMAGRVFRSPQAINKWNTIASKASGQVEPTTSGQTDPEKFEAD